MMGDQALESYVIKGGHEGHARLGIIARALAPTTAALLDRAAPLEGAVAIDVACGGGDMTLMIAERVGPQGRVLGIDLDQTKLSLARATAESRGLSNAAFEAADVLKPWPLARVGLVYARFILTHLADPAALLRRAKEALAPGGMLIVEDIDIAGRFSDPRCHAVERSTELYVAAARRNGGDPFIGRRLGRLLEAAGFDGVETALQQPYGRQGDAKQTALLTMSAIADTVVAAGLALRNEVDQLLAELEAFTDRPDTTISMPRIFQAWGRRA